jgi:hypothetical protein
MRAAEFLDKRNPQPSIVLKFSLFSGSNSITYKTSDQLISSRESGLSGVSASAASSFLPRADCRPSVSPVTHLKI